MFTETIKYCNTDSSINYFNSYNKQRIMKFSQ